MFYIYIKIFNNKIDIDHFDHFDRSSVNCSAVSLQSILFQLRVTWWNHKLNNSLTSSLLQVTDSVIQLTFLFPTFYHHSILYKLKVCISKRLHSNSASNKSRDSARIFASFLQLRGAVPPIWRRSQRGYRARRPQKFALAINDNRWNGETRRQAVSATGDDAFFWCRPLGESGLANRRRNEHNRRGEQTSNRERGWRGRGNDTRVK